MLPGKGFCLEEEHLRGLLFTRLALFVGLPLVSRKALGEVFGKRCGGLFRLCGIEPGKNHFRLQKQQRMGLGLPKNTPALCFLNFRVA